MREKQETILLPNSGIEVIGFPNLYKGRIIQTIAAVLP